MDRLDPRDNYDQSSADRSVGQSGVHQTDSGFSTQPGYAGDADPGYRNVDETAAGGHVTPATAGFAGTGSSGLPTAGAAAASGAFDPWSYRDTSGYTADQDVIGYHVEATDGKIGKIDEASNSVGESYLVVDTGPWIFGKKVMLPAGTVNNVDHADRRVYVDRTKDQIKDSPEFDPESYTNPEYRDKIGNYYGDTYQSPGMAGGYASDSDRTAADDLSGTRRSDAAGGTY